MAAPRLSEEEFIRLFETDGPEGLAKRTGVTIRNVYKRRRNLEQSLGRLLKAPTDTIRPTHHPARIPIEIKDGIALVGSDLHIWPGPASVTQRAMLKFAADMKPKALVLNGDVIDACTISRWPPIGWEKQPDLNEELEAAQDRLHEFEKATPRGCKLTWNLGNHDARFENRLAAAAPEFRKVKGIHLKDHFSAWQPAWATWINDSVVIKHRFKGGIHAPHNNVMWAGKSMITGHLHSAHVRPFSDYNGTRYGVDTGCMCDPNGPQFINYTEDNPKNHREAFAVLTFWRGQLLQPELVLAIDDKHVQFGGQVIAI